MNGSLDVSDIMRPSRKSVLNRATRHAILAREGDLIWRQA
jgi:hypothetical protein